MSDSLRRSSRRSKKRAYSVGDIVEIVHQENGRERLRTKGFLISKLTDNSSTMPRWLVGFDDDSWPEEDIYESNFGEILGKKSKDQVRQVTANGITTHMAVSHKNKKHPRKREAGSPPPTLPKSTSSTPQSTTLVNPVDSKKANGGAKKKKQVSFESSTGAAGSDSSLPLSDGSKRGSSASAREVRSRRRQAKISFPSAPEDPSPRPSKKKKKNKKDPVRDNSKVVKVPMLTGTLILYRGAHPRAEFVRKV